MKVSELKQIIKEEIVKVLAENESKPTHRSNVDWYYIEEYSDYPGPKGRTVPNARGYDDPTGYDGTELYVPEGTTGYIKNGEFIVASGKREGNSVEYKAEYFDKISGGSVNETESKNKFIDKFKEYIGDEDATESVIDYFSKKNKLTPEQKSALKNKFLSKFSIKSTGPLSHDIKPRIGK